MVGFITTNNGNAEGVGIEWGSNDEGESILGVNIEKGSAWGGNGTKGTMRT